jgi:hypothetical protein
MGQQQQQQMQQELPLAAQQAWAAVAAASLLLLQSSLTLKPQVAPQLRRHLASAALLAQQRQVHQALPTQQTQAIPRLLQVV